MVTENNSYINSFYGGMNSDSSIAQMKNSQYEESRNVRITTFSNNTGSNQSGTIVPINGLRKAYVIPIDGKANKALIEFLSKQFKVPKSYFEINAENY